MLRLQDVLCVRRGRRVLDRVSLSVGAGDLVVVDGLRGTGKSTLLALAATVLSPQGGAIFIGGRNVQVLQSASLPYVRRNIGYLPTDPMLLHHESARENVLVALAARGFSIAHAHEHAQAVLQAVGMGDAVDVLVADLSAGERRLVALARALAGAPAVIVLDDPAAGLTGADRTAIVAAIKTARASAAAVLCASADPALVAMLVDAGGEKLTLQEGRLIGSGPRMRVYDGQKTEGALAAADDATTTAAEGDAEDVQELNEADLESLSS